MSIPAQGAVGADPQSARDPITILYTNWLGETAVRRVMPCYHPDGYDALWFGKTQWHPKPQWLLSAVDCENEHWTSRFDSGRARRDFAVADIKAWGQAAVDAALASPRADSDERTAGEVLSPEAVLAALDRFTLQVLSRDVEPREDDTWAVIDTKTADPMTNWPGELAGEYPTHAEARVGLMKAALAVAAGQDRVACRKLCPSCQGSRGGMIGESGGSPDWDNCWTCNGEGFVPAQPAGAVPDSLRALSEAATKGPWAATYQEYDDWGVIRTTVDNGNGFHPVVCSARVMDDEQEQAAARRENRQPRICGANASLIVAAVNRLREEIASHPAGQSAGSGAVPSRIFGDPSEPMSKLSFSGADSTRTGQGEETVAVPASALRWLFGDGPDADGVWFGDQIRGKGAFWWRSEFRKRIEAARPAAPEAQGAEREGFNAGYAMACANIVNLHGEDTIAEDVLAESGITLAEVKALGLTDYDMKPLRALFREIARKRKISKARPAPPASSGQGGR